VELPHGELLVFAVSAFRAGNTTEGMTNITALEDGEVIRYVSVAAGGDMHVPLAIVDELQPGTEISIAAAAERAGKMMLDVGILEVNTS
jgi:assimilatory nitrate reductase catalytic subunit